ncbi:MAG TPA: hypothetical protein EYN66_01825 [Myxococcales bacterium]|nr:hypothetical protein [Myxococcales bacterium]
MDKRVSTIFFFLLLVGLYGCQSELAKIDEKLQSNQDKILQILEDNVSDSKNALKALAKLEEDTRNERSKLREAYNKEKAALGEEARTLLNTESLERWNVFSSKLGTLVKRYEKEAQLGLKKKIGQIAR